MFTLHTTEPEAANYEPADVRRQGVFHESRVPHHTISIPMVEKGPPIVLVMHEQAGAGRENLEHRVSVRAAGALLGEFPGAKAAYQWLKDRGYACIVGLNGVWRRG